EQFCILGCSADAHVERNFFEARNLHHAFIVEPFHHGRCKVFLIHFQQTGIHPCITGVRSLHLFRFLLLRWFLFFWFFFFFCHCVALSSVRYVVRIAPFICPGNSSPPH